MKKILFTTVSFVLFFHLAKAQQKYNERDFKTNPVWINMMGDSTVNYYQAIRAFNEYWQGREKPEDDADAISEKRSRQEEREEKKYKIKLTKMTPAERNEFDNLNYQYKRFKNWIFDVQPFVQPDGKILSRQERMEIRFKKLNELKKKDNTGS